MKGLITHIQRMSIHDGPGIRSTIFMKGCNMHCKWCHNPETFSMKPEVEWIADKCINCHYCAKACPTDALYIKHDSLFFDKSKCNTCFDCISECFSEALTVVGYTTTPAEIYEKIEQDLPFIKESKGGITISGGEPMLQYEFVKETLKLFNQKGIHTAIETNLSFSWSRYASVLPFTDLVMADLKIRDNDVHKAWTGIGNSRILQNLLKLDESGSAYYVRTPVIPGVNDKIEEIEHIARFMTKLKNLTSFELIPFHPMADSKYKNLQIKNKFNGTPGLSKKDLKKYDPLLIKYRLKN